MNLVLFLTIGTILTIVLGEFGKFPFGSVGNSVHILDIMTVVTVVFFLIWKVAIKQDLSFFGIQKWLLIFTLIGLLSLLLNQNFAGAMYLVRFSLYSLFFCIAYTLVSMDKKWKDYLENTIITVGCIGIITGFIQLIFYPNLTFLSIYGYDPHINRLAGTFLDPNFLGAFLTMAYCLTLIRCLRSADKKLIALLMLFTIAIILTFSRSAWLMFLIVNLFAIWFLPKKIIAGIIIVGLLSVILIPRVQNRLMGALSIDISASERFTSWDKGLKIFNMNPVYGIGYNNIRSVSIENNLLKTFTVDGGNSGSGVDSSWLVILATTGILGGIAFGYWYLKLIVIFLKQFLLKKNRDFLILGGLLMAFFVNSQFINSLFYPPMMISFFLITGMYYYEVVFKK